MTFSIWLSDAVDSRLENLAILTGHSKTFFVTQAVLEHLEELENLYLTRQELTSLYAELPPENKLSGTIQPDKLAG